MEKNISFLNRDVPFGSETRIKNHLMRHSSLIYFKFPYCNWGTTHENVLGFVDGNAKDAPFEMPLYHDQMYNLTNEDGSKKTLIRKLDDF